MYVPFPFTWIKIHQLFTGSIFDLGEKPHGLVARLIMALKLVSVNIINTNKRITWYQKSVTDVGPKRYTLFVP